MSEIFNRDEPPTSSKCRIWLNTNDGVMYVFDGLNWVTGNQGIEAIGRALSEIESDLRASALERLSMMGESDRLYLALTKIATLDPMESANADNLWARKIAREALGLLDDSGDAENKRVVPCAFTFGDARCGYTGKIDPGESCDGSIDDCRRHGNEERFGGYPKRPTMPPNETHREGEI